jgi:uncharacterized protein YggE
MRINPLAVPVACLVLGACSPPPPNPRGIDRDETLLQVSATGRADTRPDEARFTAGVATTAASAAEATAANNAQMEKVVRGVEALGVKPDDVQTRTISLAKIEYGRDRGRYRANNMVEVRMRDVDKVGQAIAAATEAGANVLSGPDLRVSDQETANRSAYANAYKAARARADAYAQAAGLKVARVLAIREAGESGGPMPYVGDGVMMEQAAQVAAPPPVSRPGLNTSQVRVQVDFALAE